MGYKGMCSDCSISIIRKDDPRKHKLCLKYKNNCMSVARNCPGPLNGMIESNWEDWVEHNKRHLYEPVRKTKR